MAPFNTPVDTPVESSESPTSDASVASTDLPSTKTLSCGGDVGGEQTVDAGCSTDADCALFAHTLDCGGSVRQVGVTASEAGRMEEWDRACWQRGPLCEFPPDWPVTEAGVEVADAGPTARCHRGQCTSAAMAPEVSLAVAVAGGAWFEGSTVILPGSEGVFAVDVSSGERQWISTETRVPLGVGKDRVYAIGGDPDRLGIRMLSVETGEDLSSCAGGNPSYRFPWQDTINQTYEHELLTAFGQLYIRSTTRTGPVPRGANMPESEPASGGTPPQIRTYWVDSSGCVSSVPFFGPFDTDRAGEAGGSIETDLWEITRGEGHPTPDGWRETWTATHLETGEVHTVADAPSLSPGHTVVDGTVLTATGNRFFGVAITGDLRWSELLLDTRYMGTYPPSSPPMGPTSGPPTRESGSD